MLIKNIYKNVAGQTGLPINTIRQITHQFFSEVSKELGEGNEIKIYGFGRFKTYQMRGARDKIIPKFVAFRKLKAYVQTDGSEPYLLRHEPEPEPFHLDY